MELEIIEKKENPLLNRIEIKFKLKHQGEKTPERELVKSEIAEMLKINKSLVVIDYIRPNFGIAMSTGYAKIYKNTEDAKKIEPSYILKRNKFEGETQVDRKEKEVEETEGKEKEVEVEKRAEDKDMKKKEDENKKVKGEDKGGNQ